MCPKSAECTFTTHQEEDDTIYDEVTEDQYKRIVKGRLQRDDFVVDDGPAGYADDGMEDWADGNEEQESEDEDEFRKGIHESDISRISLTFS